MKNKPILLVLAILLGCQDDPVVSSPYEPDASRILSNIDAFEEQERDLYMIDWVIPDMYVDPCTDVTSSQENFCECKPECCQRQMWYCPPSGLGVQAAEVTMNICDDDYNICDRSQDLTCPPNEVLSRTSCNTILECPPGIENDITITVQCEIEAVSYTHLTLPTICSV